MLNLEEIVSIQFNLGSCTMTMQGGRGTEKSVSFPDLLSLQQVYKTTLALSQGTRTAIYCVLPMLTTMPTSQLEIAEELMDEDPFIRSYPTFRRYLSEWEEMGGPEVATVPTHVVFDFYAERQTPEQALHTWFTYQ